MATEANIGQPSSNALDVTLLEATQSQIVDATSVRKPEHRKVSRPKVLGTLLLFTTLALAACGIAKGNGETTGGPLCYPPTETPTGQVTPTSEGSLPDLKSLPAAERLLANMTARRAADIVPTKPYCDPVPTAQATETAQQKEINSVKTAVEQFSLNDKQPWPEGGFTGGPNSFYDINTNKPYQLNGLIQVPYGPQFLYGELMGEPIQLNANTALVVLGYKVDIGGEQYSRYIIGNVELDRAQIKVVETLTSGKVYLESNQPGNPVPVISWQAQDAGDVGGQQQWATDTFNFLSGQVNIANRTYGAKSRSGQAMGFQINPTGFDYNTYAADPGQIAEIFSSIQNGGSSDNLPYAGVGVDASNFEAQLSQAISHPQKLTPLAGFYVSSLNS